MWLPIALIGYGSLAIVAILDKFIVEKTVPKPIVFVFYTCAVMLPVWLLAIFGFDFPTNLLDIFIGVLSGLAFVLFLWAMYKSFQKSEVSHAGPLIGALTPLFVLGLSLLFLPEQLFFNQVLAILLLVVGSLIISFEKSKKHNGLHIGMLWAVLSAFFSALFYVGSKYIYDLVGFLNGLILVFGFASIFGSALLIFRSVRKEVFAKKKSKKGTTNKLLIVGFSKILAVIGMVLVQLAVALGIVSVVNALVGFQYAILIILVALMSKFRPKLFKEEYSKFEIIQEALAVILIGVGLVLLV